MNIHISSPEKWSSWNQTGGYGHEKLPNPNADTITCTHFRQNLKHKLISNNWKFKLIGQSRIWTITKKWVWNMILVKSICDIQCANFVLSVWTTRLYCSPTTGAHCHWYRMEGPPCQQVLLRTAKTHHYHLHQREMAILETEGERERPYTRVSWSVSFINAILSIEVVCKSLIGRPGTDTYGHKFTRRRKMMDKGPHTQSKIVADNCC